MFILSLRLRRVKISDVSHPFEGGVSVDVEVSPRSSRSGPEGFDEWRRRLIVRVKAPPLEGKANKEVEEIVKDLTGFPAEITAGHQSRQKTVTIYGDPDTIMKTLGERI